MTAGSALHAGLLVLLLETACAAPAVTSRNTPLVGIWNGPHASLVLGDSAGTIEYDCGRGTLSSALLPDSNGNFDIPGFHIGGHGGPVRMDEVPDSVPAHYTGRVAGATMTLRVLLSNGAPGQYTLRRGAASQLVRCY